MLSPAPRPGHPLLMPGPGGPCTMRPVEPLARTQAETPDVLEPIAGVSLGTFVDVSRRLVRFQFDADHAIAIAAEHGIGAHDWTEASEGWTDRLRTSGLVSTEFARLYHGARP